MMSKLMAEGLPEQGVEQVYTYFILTRPVLVVLTLSYTDKRGVLEAVAGRTASVKRRCVTTGISGLIGKLYPSISHSLLH